MWFLIKVFEIVSSDTCLGCTCFAVLSCIWEMGRQRMCGPNLAVTTSTEMSVIPSHTDDLTARCVTKKSQVLSCVLVHSYPIYSYLLRFSFSSSIEISA